MATTGTHTATADRRLGRGSTVLLAALVALGAGASACSSARNDLEDPAAQEKPVKAYVEAVQARDVDRLAKQAAPGIDGRTFAQAKVNEFGGRFSSDVRINVIRGDANLAKAEITAVDAQQRPVADEVVLSYSSSENQWFVGMNTAPPNSSGSGPSPAVTASAN